MFRRTISNGVDRVVGNCRHPRHQHAEAYATIVLGGAYEQLAYAGRLQIQGGDVVIQPTLDCHGDLIASRDVQLLRLPWRRDPGLGGVYRGIAVDDIVRAARHNPDEASFALAAKLAGRAPRPPAMEDLADLLAGELRCDHSASIGTWARSKGVSREYVTRSFTALYGVAPARYRFELRARAAWLMLTSSKAPLAGIALDLGFADQAHMTRAIKWLTGENPTWWRRRSP
jgi:AraC-like DNA-binding protein